MPLRKILKEKDFPSFCKSLTKTFRELFDDSLA
jgi:hypothetical protein